jgi:hypothetical protein
MIFVAHQRYLAQETLSSSRFDSAIFARRLAVYCRSWARFFSRSASVIASLCRRRFSMILVLLS